MTRERDIERVLDRWFSEGPTHVSDRFFDSVADRLDRAPQRRLAGLQMRFLAMQPTLRFAGAAIVIAAVVGLGAIAFSGGTENGPTPTASPTAPPSVAPSGGPLTTALRHYWIGAPRAIPALIPARDFAGIRMGATTMQFDGGTNGGRNDFPSLASLVAPDRIAFVLTSATAGCAKGDAGTYRFSLSPGGGSLTLTTESDACAPRSQALAGDWARSVCPNTGADCLGPLEAGNHVSVIFNPFVPVDRWTFSYGRLGYTVPEGWQNDEEDRGVYVISRQGAGEDASIWLLSEVAAHDQAADCSDNVAAAGVDRTEAALASWLTTVPGLKSTKATTVTLGGLTGVTMDLSVDPGWTRVCPGGAVPAVKVFADANGAEHDVEVDAGTPLRIFLLDLGDGRTLLVFIHAVDRVTWDSLINEAMPIVQSFQLNR